MAGRAPAGWAAQAERCASSVPACFRDDPAVVHVFLNGARTFWGVEKLKPETLKWGETGETQVNACVERLPPRLTDDDVGITQEQWDSFIADLNATFERLPPVRGGVVRKRLLWLSCERAVCCVIHALPTQDPLVGTITLRLINEDDWKAAVREVVDKHVECTFGRSGFSSVAFEEAYWTVSEVDAAAPPEGPEQGFNDRVAQPRAMPVVSLRLRFPTRAAFERFAADAAAAEVAPAGAAAGGGKGKGGRAAVAQAHSSLLPWARRWELCPPTRVFGAPASYHT